MKKILKKLFCFVDCFNNTRNTDDISLNTINSFNNGIEESILGSRISVNSSINNQVVETTVNLGNRAVKFSVDSNTWFKQNPGSLFKLLGREPISNINRINSEVLDIPKAEPITLCDRGRSLLELARPDSPILGDLDLTPKAYPINLPSEDNTPRIKPRDLSDFDLSDIDLSDIDLSYYDSDFISVIEKYAIDDLGNLYDLI